MLAIILLSILSNVPRSGANSVFNFDVEDKELIWHRDKLDRKIKVVSGVNWKLQMDNELPEVLKVGNEYNIPKMVYHRLHKGEGRLIIDIKEYEERK